MCEGRIGIIVLGAGASIRMGRPKQLIPIAGVPLIRRAARIAIDAGGEPVCVVLGANEAIIRPSLAGLNITVVVNSEWQTGLASSIRCGLQAILDRAPGTGHALLMVADQPEVSAVSLQKIIQAGRQSGSGLVAAFYNGGFGTPAIFGRPYFKELLTLDGTHGAKTLLERYHLRIRTVPLPEAARDLDTQEDLEVFTLGNGDLAHHGIPAVHERTLA